MHTKTHINKIFCVFAGILILVFLVFSIGSFTMSRADEDYTWYESDETDDQWYGDDDTGAADDSWSDTDDTDTTDASWSDSEDTWADTEDEIETDDTWYSSDESDESWYDASETDTSWYDNSVEEEETTSEEETDTSEEETTADKEEETTTSEEETTAPEKEEKLLTVPDPAAIKEEETRPITAGDYFIRNIASSYVYFSTPEVEAENIPLVAKASLDPSAFEGENGEGLVNNLQMEILGEDLLPIHVEFDEEGYAIFSIGDTGKVLGLAGNVRDGVNIMAVDRAPSVYPAPTHGRLKGAIYGQRWILEQQDDGTVLIRSAADSDYMMTIDDRYGIHYANLMLWEETKGKTQEFLFSEETPRIVPSVLEEGTYFVRSGVSDWFLMSIGDDVYNDERDIYIWESDQGDGQMFSVEYDDYGFAVIHHNDSSKVLTVRESVARDGQSIGQCEYDGGNWQRWIIEARKDGGYNILSALNTSELIDLSNGSIRNGNSICLEWRNGSEAQQWFFHTDPVPAPPYDKIMQTLAQSYSSDTGFLIMVDTYTCQFGVYQGSKGNWKELHFWDCVTGKPGTPTPLGEFVIYDHLWSFDGNEDSPVWYSVYYASEFLPSYYIHSIIYYQGTFDLLDATMGWNASHGCIRLYTENAEWVYNNIPGGTKVVIY